MDNSKSPPVKTPLKDHRAEEFNQTNAKLRAYFDKVNSEPNIISVNDFKEISVLHSIEKTAKLSENERRRLAGIYRDKIDIYKETWIVESYTDKPLKVVRRFPPMLTQMDSVPTTAESEALRHRALRDRASLLPSVQASGDAAHINSFLSANDVTNGGFSERIINNQRLTIDIMTNVYGIAPRPIGEQPAQGSDAKPTITSDVEEGEWG